MASATIEIEIVINASWVYTDPWVASEPCAFACVRLRAFACVWLCVNVLLSRLLRRLRASACVCVRLRVYGCV
jgi:hypothetical protein